jgi:DNA recombination protein RmuC
VEKLQTHFRQAVEDVAQIRTSTDKVTKRARDITAVELESPGEVVAIAETVAPKIRQL